MIRVAWFLFWRTWWALSLRIGQAAMDAGLTGWPVEVICRVAGTRYAWRLARWSGWSGRVQ